jgi:hypothetical protein
MQLTGQFGLPDLEGQAGINLPPGGSVEKQVFTDKYGAGLTVLVIHNGLMTITVLPDRGMEIGDIRYAGEKMSWDRSSQFLVHPEHVNLEARNGTGWLDGFYSAAATIGPELFGTPGEGYTLHGTGSYSPAKPESVLITYDEVGVRIEGTIVCRGYSDSPVFEKEISIFSEWHSSILLREETTVNVSDTEQTVDDGHHIQLSGSFLHEGGRYVLPVAQSNMLLRDGAAPEEDPFRIPALAKGHQPIRCYQYVPEPVSGLQSIDEIKSCVAKLKGQNSLTAEMIVNKELSAAGFVIRPLDCFPRSLIAKEIGESFMFSFEPCRTRPNRMSQKHIDGEAFVLQPSLSAFTQCIIGVTKNISTINALENSIKRHG